MKNLFFILLFFLSCLACGRQPPEMARNQNNRLRNSTVALVNRFLGGELSNEIEDVLVDEERFVPYCSGIFIDKDLILTASHCVDIDIPEIVTRMIRLDPSLDEHFPKPIGKLVRFSTFQMYDFGRIQDSRVAHVVRFNRITDLALLRVARNQDDFIRDFISVKNGLTGLREGDFVYTIGHPGGALWTFTVGRVSAVVSRDLAIINAWNYTQVDATIWRGNSGGGLVDSRGFLVGICSMVRNDSRQSYFVNHREILRFLNR